MTQVSVLVTREDDVYLIGSQTAHRHRIPEDSIRPLVAGDELREWGFLRRTEAIFPVTSGRLCLEISCGHGVLSYRVAVAYGRNAD